MSASSNCPLFCIDQWYISNGIMVYVSIALSGVCLPRKSTFFSREQHFIANLFILASVAWPELLWEPVNLEHPIYQLKVMSTTMDPYVGWGYGIPHKIAVLCFVLFRWHNDTWWILNEYMSCFYSYASRLLRWHWGNRMIALVPVKQPWRIWVKLIAIRPQQSKARTFWSLPYGIIELG